MKRIFGVMILVLAITGCQKPPDTARIGSNNDRTGGLPPGATSTPNGITLNGIVTADAAYQSQFEDEVKDFLEGSIDPTYVGTVSSQGANQTGVFVGGKIELANGQPLTAAVNGNQPITTTSQLLITVFDKFQDQTNMAPIPSIYFKQASGYVSGNNVFMDFTDARGTVHLEGTFDASVVVLKFSFNTIVTWDSQQGYRGTLGDLRIPKCAFFRCQ
jgi:hypothetical protein